MPGIDYRLREANDVAAGRATRAQTKDDEGGGMVETRRPLARRIE